MRNAYSSGVTRKYKDKDSVVFDPRLMRKIDSSPSRLVQPVVRAQTGRRRGFSGVDISDDCRQRSGVGTVG